MTAIRMLSSAASGLRTPAAFSTVPGSRTSSAIGIPVPASKWPTSTATAVRTLSWRRRNWRATGIGFPGSKPRPTPGRPAGRSMSSSIGSSASFTAWRPPISTAMGPWTSPPPRCTRARTPMRSSSSPTATREPPGTSRSCPRKARTASRPATSAPMAISIWSAPIGAGRISRWNCGRTSPAAVRRSDGYGLSSPGAHRRGRVRARSPDRWKCLSI